MKPFMGEVLVHRLTYRLVNGEIPDGLKLDHTCHNRWCVNPQHLRLATTKQNAENRAGANRRNSSGHRGVYWDARRGKWLAQVRHEGHIRHVGYFGSVEEASDAVARKRRELFTHSDMDAHTLEAA